MNKRNAMISAILAIVIISSFIAYNTFVNRDDGISAKEGLDKAYEIAREWNESAVLGSVSTIDDVCLNGKSSYWAYGFSNPYNYSSMIDVKVYYSGKTETHIYSIELNVSYDPALWKWNVDSTEAYEIAMKNPEVRNFVSKYSIDQLEFSLGGETPTWIISFIDWGLWDDPHHIMVKIDSNTGEVTYVGR